MEKGINLQQLQQKRDHFAKKVKSAMQLSDGANHFIKKFAIPLSKKQKIQEKFNLYNINDTNFRNNKNQDSKQSFLK